MLNILFIGDVVGKPGRDCVKHFLPEIQKEYQVDFVIANGENASAGLGINQKAMDELFGAGVNTITGGNHIFDNREVFNFIDKEERILRPVNFAGGLPGKGVGLYPVKGHKLAVLNLQGKTFMPPINCPFESAIYNIKKIKESTLNVIIDFHAEATSEKIAMGHYLDGMVSAVLGTHTHVQTADERILPYNTAYISDTGMTSPYNSVLGVNTGKAIFKFVTGMPVRLEVSDSSLLQFNAVVIKLEETTGKSLGIERIFRTCYE